MHKLDEFLNHYDVKDIRDLFGLVRNRVRGVRRTVQAGVSLELLAVTSLKFPSGCFAFRSPDIKMGNPQLRHSIRSDTIKSRVGES